MKLDWYFLCRDSFCYAITVLALLLVLIDQKVFWYESVILILLYILYAVLIFFNESVETFIKIRSKNYIIFIYKDI